MFQAVGDAKNHSSRELFLGGRTADENLNNNNNNINSSNSVNDVVGIPMSDKKNFKSKETIDEEDVYVSMGPSRDAERNSDLSGDTTNNNTIKPPLSFWTLEYMIPSIFIFVTTFVQAVKLFVLFHKAIKDREKDFLDLKKPMKLFQILSNSPGVDISDMQLRAYYLSNPEIIALALGTSFGMYVVVPLLYQRLGLTQAQGKAVVCFLVGLGYAAVLHGPHVIFLFALLLLNYLIFHTLPRTINIPRWLFQVVQWTIHISLLYIIELYSGFENTAWIQNWLVSSEDASEKALGYAKKPLWESYVRWIVLYRMSALRMIAFNYDSWEAQHTQQQSRDRAILKHTTTCVDCAELREANSIPTFSPTSGATVEGAVGDESQGSLPPEQCRCYKFRTEYPREQNDYNLLYYGAYMLFPPLYLAGPMMSFNSFVSYLHAPSALSKQWKYLFFYGVRILVILFLELFVLHNMYVCAATTWNSFFLRQKISIQASILYLYLGHLWLKFAFLWRTSRLYSLWCGVEPPEDMRRCFSNTLTVRDFWRDWHASFNLWIVRYMYIPMGGKGNIVFSIFPIFLFIAVWHDPELHLIKWAACIVSIFVLEIAVQYVYDRFIAPPVQRKMRLLQNGELSMHLNSNGGVSLCIARLLCRCSPEQRSFLYRTMRAFAGQVTVLGLILANLIGFNYQYSEGKSVTDSTMMQALRQCGGSLGVMIFLCTLFPAGLAGVWRDREKYEIAMKKKKYGLK